MLEVVHSEVLYDFHAGAPSPHNVRVVFTMRDVSPNRIEGQTYAVLFDPSKPKEGGQQWVRL